MKILAKYSHPKTGSAYLWSPEGFKYKLGTVSTNYMEFDGYTLEEAKKKILVHGFVEVDLNAKTIRE